MSSYRIQASSLFWGMIHQEWTGNPYPTTGSSLSFEHWSPRFLCSKWILDLQYLSGWWESFSLALALMNLQGYPPKTTVSRHFVKENKWSIPFLHVMLDVLCWSYCSPQPWNAVCFPTGRREFWEIATMRLTSFECDHISNPGHRISQDGV